MTTENQDLGGFLAGITYGIQPKPIFCLIHGVDGVGKTTWACGAPAPVVLDLESGSNQLKVARLPKPETFLIFLNQLTGLHNQEHPFKSIIIDPIDWLEPLIWKQVCTEGQVKTIEDYGGGYGKGYIRALEIWRGVLKTLYELALHYHVILVAHAKIKGFNDPQLPSAYDRYILQLNDQAAAAVRQAVDTVLFATFKEKVRQVNKAVGKGIGEGERVLYTEHRPAFDAKNRFNLPFELPLEWRAFASKVKEFYAGPQPAQPQPVQLVEGDGLGPAAAAVTAPSQETKELQAEVANG
jgi:hypothetical protein